MKSNFAEKFFEIVEEMANTAGDLVEIVLIRESMERKLMRAGGLDPDQIYGGFNNFKNRGILEWNGKNYKFTKEGARWFRDSEFKYLKLGGKKWDKKWRIVMFDIPMELHKQRILLRKKLIQVGFFPLQKSVFVFPYSCEYELGRFCKGIGVEEYVDILTADSVGFKEKEIKRHFNL